MIVVEKLILTQRWRQKSTGCDINQIIICLQQR